MYRDRDKALARRDGKNYAMPACHRDSFLARNRDSQPDGFAGNANSLNCRAVGGNSQREPLKMIELMNEKNVTRLHHLDSYF